MKAVVSELATRLDEISHFGGKEETAFLEEARTFFLTSVKNLHSRLSAEEAKERAIKMLGEVGIAEPERRYKQYPFELSGGMRQRIVIAIALCSNPEILICDEPTTALDVTIQSQILELINKLKKEKNLSIVFITHDLGVVANMITTLRPPMISAKRQSIFAWATLMLAETVFTSTATIGRFRTATRPRSTIPTRR